MVFKKKQKIVLWRILGSVAHKKKIFHNIIHYVFWATIIYIYIYIYIITLNKLFFFR